MTSSQHQWPQLAQLVRASRRYRKVMGSNPIEVLNFSGFFSYAIAKIAFITARIIASLDFISAVHIIMIHFIYHFIVDSFLMGTLEPTNDQLPTSVAS